MTEYQEYKREMCLKHFGVETEKLGHPNYFSYLRDMARAPTNYDALPDDDQEPELDWIDLDCMRYHNRKDD
jgi:hypothetical protein